MVEMGWDKDEDGGIQANRKGRNEMMDRPIYLPPWNIHGLLLCTE